MQHQHASPRVAECIATGYDYAASSRLYDRLGFTQTDISNASVRPAAIMVSGEARRRTNSDWVDVTLNCVSAKGKLIAINIKR